MSFVQQVYGSSPRALQRQKEDFPETNETLFAPYLWTTNGPGDTSFSTISYNNVIEVPFSMFKRSDLIGLIWESTDRYSHAGRAYNTFRDYSGVLWEFDIELSANMPVINEPARAFTITIENSQGVCYVPLAPYCTTPDARTSRVFLDFDNLVGNVFQGPQNVPIDPNGINKIMFSLINDSYVKDDTTNLLTREDSLFKLTNVLTSWGRPFTRKNFTAPTQDVGAATSYDDMHNQSPERVIKQLKALGYGGRINHYCGMSRYPNREVNLSLGRTIIQETLGNTVIESAKRWHEVFAQLLAAEGWDCIWAVSFEMYSIMANINYAQRDDDGVLGFTGYTPTSYLLSPVVTAQDIVDFGLTIPNHTQVGSMVYLGNVFEDFGNIMKDNGLPVIMQIGEPWWWWNPNGAPCYYGAVARQKYFDETGNFAPRIMSVNDLTGIDIEDNTPYTGLDSAQMNFIKWTRDKLGDATHYLRDRIRAVDVTAQATLLFFLPTILNPDVGFVNIVNYPKAYYESPAFDFFMTEAYDWVIKGTGSKADRAITLSTEELGYSYADTEILVGFVPDVVLASAFNWTLLDDIQYKRELWGRLFGSIEKNRAANNGNGVGRQYIWSYPQIMRDNIIVKNGEISEGLERQDIRKIESDYPPTFIDFASLIDPNAPPSAPIPTNPNPEEPLFDASYRQYVLGDGFVSSDLITGVKENAGAVQAVIEGKSLGETSLSLIADELDSDTTKQHYNLIVMEGNLETTPTESIDAIERMRRRITHDRWLYVEPSPYGFATGTTERAYRDGLLQAIKDHVPAQNYVDTLTLMQAGNDGSPEDLEDVANGLIPRSLRVNSIQENTAGKRLRGKIIADKLNANNWHYNPSVAWDCHFIGDSSIDSSYSPVEDTQLFAREVFGNRFNTITMDGIGGTTYAQQAERFALTPEHYDKTLIIWESGGEDFSSDAILAIEDMVSRLSHNRWVFVQWQPLNYKLGTTERAFIDSENSALRTHFGDDHYVEMLPRLQQKAEVNQEDGQDVIDGLIPRSLLIDPIHFNIRGHRVAFNIIADRIRELGY